MIDSESSAQQEHGKLLLVEDDAAFAHVTSRALARRGYSVRHADSSVGARSLIASEIFDHAILDLNLGGHSSLELIPLLRARNEAMQILILTGYASITTAVEAIKLGADNYLAKPADADEILQALWGGRPLPSGGETICSSPMSVRRLEWEHIQKVLKENEGNISETARQLKMHRRTLQRKLQKRPVAN
jgi:two-component system, response regulator RegA